MRLPITTRQLRYTACYLITAFMAAVLLIVMRWDAAVGPWGRLGLVADSVWQGSVWPLYLLVRLTGGS